MWYTYIMVLVWDLCKKELGRKQSPPPSKMDPSSEEQRMYKSEQLWTSSRKLSSADLADGTSSLVEEEEEKNEASSPAKAHGLELLLAPHSYNNSSGDDDTRSGTADEEEEARSSGEEDEDDMNAASAVMAIGYASSHDESDVAWTQTGHAEPIDYLEVSLESLELAVQQRGLDSLAISRWRVEDGKLVDPDQYKYRNLRDALRAYTYMIQGVIPREDVYYLAILRRKIAQMTLPLVDGPISVMALGSVIPEKHFYTSKRLFPVRK